MKLQRPVLLSALLLLSMPCVAHDPLPNANWCEGGRTVVVASFTLHPAVLVAERDRCSTRTGGAGAGRECGQFDDDYDLGVRSSSALCQQYQGGVTGPGDRGTVVALITEPSSYLHSSHHALYKAEHGLAGHCVRCEAVPVLVQPRR